MGRNRYNRKGGSRGGGGGQPKWKPKEKPLHSERVDYVEVEKVNEKFENYYRSQGFIGDEEEFKKFWAAMKEPLPTTWRFTGSKGHAIIVRNALLQKHIPHLSNQTFEGEQIPPPTPLPWFPDSLAWQLKVAKSVIRRSPPFKNLQGFLVSETTCGNISRQEAVSMIPPLLLKVEPHHTVLDLCAAPGSKTAQLIEAIHAGEENRIVKATHTLKGKNLEDGKFGEYPEVKLGHPTGLVVANDKDFKRSHMLIHQTKRLNSPNLIVTNHDATQYPSLRLPTDKSVAPEDGKQVKQEYLKFDRVLCDVPCSGDGTVRKNPGIWKDWSSGNGIGLWPTQVRILVRGLQLLKPGGRLVYSTCSLNPMENESVINTAIERCGLDKIELVDVSDELPGLKRNPGLTGGWKILDKDGTWYTKWEQVVEAGSPQRDRLLPGMFPPDENLPADKRVPLERCVRVYPHMQDTGGFFIAVLHKKADFRPKPEKDVEVKSTTQDDIKTRDEVTTEDATMADTPAVPTTGEKRSLEDDESGTTSPLKRVKTDIETMDAEVPSPNPDDLGDIPEEIIQPVKKMRAGSNITEEPFKFLSPTNSVLQEIQSFYDISPHFPSSNFLVRNMEGIPTKTIYYTTSLARGILTENEGRSVKFVHCGVKMFNRQDVQGEEGTCSWRIQNEGMNLVAPWVGEKREIALTSRETLRTMLKEMFPRLDETAECLESLKKLNMGCCVLRIELEKENTGNSEKENGEGDVTKEGEKATGFSEKMVLPLWKSRQSVNLMLPKEERQAMLLRLYDDNGGVQDSSKARRMAAAEAKKASQLFQDGEQEDVDDKENEEANDVETGADEADAEEQPNGEVEKMQVENGSVE